MKYKSSLAASLGALAFALAPMVANAVCDPNIDASTPDSRFAVAAETVSDTATGLMWKRCSEGLSGVACATGAAVTGDWQDALARAATVNAQPTVLGAGHSDWRLPNRNELASLVERRCQSPAINETVFPGTLSQSFWTSSPSSQNGLLAWYVDFDIGDVGPILKSGARNIRLVRTGN